MFGSPGAAARGLASASGLIHLRCGGFPMNTDLIEQNVHRLLGAMTGAATTAMVAVGDQLGLYRALAGAGIAWHEQDPAVFEGTERFFRPGYVASLTTQWVPALPGVAGRLAAGGRVADVGCGHGAAAILLARAYPQASVHGYDFHHRSIQVARQRAGQAGLGGRIHFEPLDATSYPADS